MVICAIKIKRINNAKYITTCYLSVKFDVENWYLPIMRQNQFCHTFRIKCIRVVNLECGEL
jgi:hypothetical protein